MAWPRHLSHLRLYDVRLGHDGLRLLLGAFAREPWALRLLDLSYNPRLGDQGLRELALCPQLTHLEALRLRRCQISSEGLAAMFELNPPWLSRLRHVDLSDNHIGDRGASLLASFPGWATGATINLGDNRFSEVGLEAIRSSPSADRVTFVVTESRVWGSLLD